MEKMKVRDLMVSTDRFPKISNGAGYFEALSALEIAQQKYLSKESEQRILLVENEKGKVKEFIREPAKGQSIRADDALVKCFHLFVMNRHDALFVFEKDEIIGVLTFSDVFEKTSQVMKECSI